jgi:hypothetical protein
MSTISVIERRPDLARRTVACAPDVRLRRGPLVRPGRTVRPAVFRAVSFTVPAGLGASHAELVAEFASWVPLAMDRSSDGGFSIVVHLEAGRTWQYGFLLDGIRTVSDRRTAQAVNHVGDLVSVVST